jgi:hypothetical protein
MINSNYYIMDAYSWNPTKQQAARAANLIFIMMQYQVPSAAASNAARLRARPRLTHARVQRTLERSEMQPLLVEGAVPLCMNQHVRTFGTCRIPYTEEGASAVPRCGRAAKAEAPISLRCLRYADVIQHVPNSRYVAVLSRGSYYVVNVYDVKGVRMSARDLER